MLTEIKVACRRRPYRLARPPRQERIRQMPLSQTLFLVATVAAFKLFGLTLAFCRTVSKDFPRGQR